MWRLRLISGRTDYSRSRTKSSGYWCVRTSLDAATDSVRRIRHPTCGLKARKMRQPGWLWCSDLAANSGSGRTKRSVRMPIRATCHHSMVDGFFLAVEPGCSSVTERSSSSGGRLVASLS